MDMTQIANPLPSWPVQLATTNTRPAPMANQLRLGVGAPGARFADHHEDTPLALPVYKQKPTRAKIDYGVRYHYGEIQNPKK